MKTQMQEASVAKVRQCKQQIEERYLDLACIGREDFHICVPNIQELLPSPVDKHNLTVSLAEAIWLKIAVELLRSRFDHQTIVTFSYALLGRFLVPEGETQVVEDGMVITEDAFRLLDQMIGFVVKEKQDVLVQFNRAGEMGLRIGIDEGRMLKSNCISFSVHELMIQINNIGIRLENQKTERLTKAEAALVAVARDPAVQEFQVEKARNDGNYQWDLVIHKEGLATKKVLHELMHTSFNGHGTFQIISTNRSQAFYKQTQRLRF